MLPGQSHHHLEDDDFKYTITKNDFRTLIKTSLDFVPKHPIENLSALVQLMIWGSKPKVPELKMTKIFDAKWHL